MGGKPAEPPWVDVVREGAVGPGTANPKIIVGYSMGAAAVRPPSVTCGTSAGTELEGRLATLFRQSQFPTSSSLSGLLSPQRASNRMTVCRLLDMSLGGGGCPSYWELVEHRVLSLGLHLARLIMIRRFSCFSTSQALGVTCTTPFAPLPRFYRGLVGSNACCRD